MKKTSLGEIKTMADDLLVAEGKKPQAEEPQTPKPSDPPPAVTPKTPPNNTLSKNNTSSEDIKKLLPFEGEDVSEEKPLAPKPKPAPITPPKPLTPTPELKEEPFNTKPATPKPPPATPKPVMPKPLPVNEATKKPQQVPPPPQTNKKIQPPPIKQKSNKLWLFIALGVLGLVIFSGVSYLFLNQEEAQPNNNDVVDNNPPTQQELDKTPPAPLVNLDYIQPISISDTTHSTLLSTLNLLPEKAEDLSLSSESLTYLPIMLKGVVEEGNKAKFIDSETLLNGLGISYPDNLFAIAEKDALLFMYQPGQEERIMCQNNLVTEKSCYGVRLGVVFKAKEGLSQELVGIKSAWENGVVESNLNYLALNNLAKAPESSEFSLLEYSGNQVSYINLAMPSYNNLRISSTSIDMVVVNDYLVIGTSKNSTLKIIDQLLKEVN